ncbi:MAG: ATP-binding protein [Chloroflexaceae bacterium]|nr:ATP-binding protein [Chloroflexaceae bacterium]
MNNPLAAPWRAYALAVLTVALALGLTLVLQPLVAAPFASLFLAAVAVSAWYGGLGPGLLAASLGLLASATLVSAFNLQQGLSELLRFVVFGLVAVLISSLAAAQRRSAAEADAQRERFQRLAENAPDIIYRYRLEPEPGMDYVSPAAATITGYSPASYQSNPALATMLLGLNPVGLRPEQLTGPVEMALRHQDGRKIWLEQHYVPVQGPDGRLLAVESVARDITARRRAEAVLQLLANASTNLFESLDYTITLQRLARLVVPELADFCIIDMVDDKGAVQLAVVAHADPAREPLLHELRNAYPLQPNSNQPAWQVLQHGEPLLVSKVTSDWLNQVTLDEGHRQLLYQLELHSTLMVPLRLRGQVQGVLSLASREDERYSATDVALVEDLASRAALALDNARIYDSTQAAVVQREQFLSLATHELKTPLTSLMGYVEMMNRRMGLGHSLSDKDQRALSIIYQQAIRINRMLNALLDVSRLEVGQLTIEQVPVNLTSMVQRMVDEIRPTLSLHKLEAQLPPEPLMIVGDELRLEQVVLNLLQNAIKYSPKGGQIRIQVERDGDHANITVQDEGIGVPHDAQAHLFSRFYRAKNVDSARQIPGMGIGLYVVREVVTRHGGCVNVESEEGHGSTFTVSLPAMPSEVHEAMPALTSHTA